MGKRMMVVPLNPLLRNSRKRKRKRKRKKRKRRKKKSKFSVIDHRDYRTWPNFGGGSKTFQNYSNEIPLVFFVYISKKHSFQNIYISSWNCNCLVIPLCSDKIQTEIQTAMSVTIAIKK